MQFPVVGGPTTNQRPIDRCYNNCTWNPHPDNFEDKKEKGKNIRIPNGTPGSSIKAAIPSAWVKEEDFFHLEREEKKKNSGSREIWDVSTHFTHADLLPDRPFRECACVFPRSCIYTVYPHRNADKSRLVGFARWDRKETEKCFYGQFYFLPLFVSDFRGTIKRPIRLWLDRSDFQSQLICNMY